MRTVRIYEPQGNLHENMEITLSENGSGHLCRVLRFKEGESSFVNALSRIEGVSNVVLVSYNGDYMG